jgi:membrane associated rhomboid family serine protease
MGTGAEGHFPSSSVELLRALDPAAPDPKKLWLPTLPPENGGAVTKPLSSQTESSPALAAAQASLARRPWLRRGQDSRLPWWITDTPVCLLLLLLQAALLLAAVVMDGGTIDTRINPMGGASGRTLVRLGAGRQADIAEGHVYQLITAALVPTGVLRALTDCASLAWLGMAAEQRLGSSAVAGAYLAGAWMGSLCNAVFTAPWLFAGAGTALCALAGQDLIETYLERCARVPAPEARVRLRRALLVIIFCLLLGGFPGQTNWGQVSGERGGLGHCEFVTIV